MYTGFYQDALFIGMTANALKLGTALHLGWFWQRINGCSVLYRGTGIDTIDFDNVLDIIDFDADQIQPPAYLEHLPDSSYYYVLRRVNSSGEMELTFYAAAKLDIDSGGKLAQSTANSIFIIKAETIDSDKVKLEWFYCPLQQNSKPINFNIYTDSGSGQIDYQERMAQIKYQGRKFYTHTTQSLQNGKHLFAVRVEDDFGTEDVSQKTVSIKILENLPPSILFASIEIL